MAELNILIETARNLPWTQLLLGSLLATSSLSTFLIGQGVKHLKDMAMTYNEPNTKTVVDTEPPEHEPSYEDGENTQATLRWGVDGASRKGKFRPENQDAFVILPESEAASFLAVFDGAGGIEGGYEAAQSAANICQTVMQDPAKSTLSPAERMQLAIQEARINAKRKALPGLTTAILAYIDGCELTYATLGDGALAIVWPDRMVGQILVPHHAYGKSDNIITAFIGNDCDVPLRTGTVRLEIGSSLILMSDGASDLFPYDEYTDKHKLFGAYLSDESIRDTADYFLREIERARDPETDAYLHDDNMTLILAHLSEFNPGDEEAAILGSSSRA